GAGERAVWAGRGRRWRWVVVVDQVVAVEAPASRRPSRVSARGAGGRRGVGVAGHPWSTPGGALGGPHGGSGPLLGAQGVLPGGGLGAQAGQVGPLRWRRGHHERGHSPGLVGAEVVSV